MLIQKSKIFSNISQDFPWSLFLWDNVLAGLASQVPRTFQSDLEHLIQERRYLPDADIPPSVRNTNNTEENKDPHIDE